MKVNILIKGFGSIGKRHYKVLKELYPCAHIDIISSQNIQPVFRTFLEIQNLDFYDYFILATPTSEHYADLLFLDQHVQNKIIFVEKPLFSKAENFIQTKKNKIYIGYVMRFHPLLQYVKKILCNYHAYYVEVSCGSYLPNWRTGVDYRKIYSAKSELGGGVLLDLSHEIDYLQWIFGDFQEIKGINTKISELEINTDDLATFIIQTTKQTLIDLSLNYFSKIPKRLVTIHTANFSLELDLINNTLKRQNIDYTIFEKKIALEENEEFKSMHLNTLESQDKILPCFIEGMQIMNILARMRNAI